MQKFLIVIDLCVIAKDNGAVVIQKDGKRVVELYAALPLIHVLRYWSGICITKTGVM